MDTDTAVVILTVILAVGAAYAGLSRSISRVETQLGERLARVEGIIEGWLNPPPAPPDR